MTKINPGKYENEFLVWLNNSYQGSDKRRYRYYTEELFRQGKQNNFSLDTEDVENSIAELKHLIRYDLDYSLWPPVSYAYQKVLDYLINKFPDDERALKRIRNGINPSEFEEMDEHNYFDKSLEEKAKKRKKQLIDGKALKNVFDELDWEKEVILRTLYDTACRRGEIIAIKVKNLNFDSNFAPVAIELNRQGTQNDEGQFVVENTLKIRDNRLVMGSEDTRELLKRYIKENDLQSDDFLFFSNVKRSTAYAKIQNLIDEAFQGHPKPDNLTPHNFRHTRATEIVRKYSLNDAKEYLGHEHIQNTEVYSHIDIETDVLQKISGVKEPNEDSSEESSPEKILKERYAKGDIESNEFKERMKNLREF